MIYSRSGCEHSAAWCRMALALGLCLLQVVLVPLPGRIASAARLASSGGSPFSEGESAPSPSGDNEAVDPFKLGEATWSRGHGRRQAPPEMTAFAFAGALEWAARDAVRPASEKRTAGFSLAEHQLRFGIGTPLRI